MALPKRKYYSLEKAAKELECDVDDLLHYASLGILQICVYIEINEDEGFSECFIDSDVDDELLESLSSDVNPTPLRWATELNYIVEDARFFLLSRRDDDCDSKINSAGGFFALNHTELSTPKFEKDRKIEVFYLGHLREHYHIVSGNQFGGSTPGYEPGSILFYKPRKFEIHDFCITLPELELLKKGGENLLHSAFGYNHRSSELIGRKKENFSKHKASLIRSLTELAFVKDGGISKLSMESIADQLQRKFMDAEIDYDDLSPSNLRNWLGTGRKDKI